MKRFIYIGDQICKDEKAFAWFDTVVSEFETHSDCQVWVSWEEFIADFEGDDLDRYKTLFIK